MLKKTLFVFFLFINVIRNRAEFDRETNFLDRIQNIPSCSIESRPQRFETVHKYSQTLASLVQPTTNQITTLAFTLKKQNYSPLAPNTRLIEN